MPTIERPQSLTVYGRSRQKSACGTESKPCEPYLLLLSQVPKIRYAAAPKKALRLKLAKTRVLVKPGESLHDKEPSEKAPVAAGVVARGWLVFGHALTSVFRLPFQTQDIELGVTLPL